MSVRTVRVNTAKAYDVLIGQRLLERTGELSAEVIPPCKAAIITDDIVAGLYLDTVERSLARAGYAASRFIIGHGEASKNMRVLGDILEFLAENQFTRPDAVIALGGGVVGDIAGFAAAVYLRGIRFIQIPTTLLAQVDSSVGGKTAVDLSAGKNLAGAFYQPELVICDVLALDTLEYGLRAQGMAEVIKYGVVFDRELFDKVAGEHDIAEVVERCVSLKRGVVERDEFDKGERQLLNFGHTIGHGIELLSGYTISHGEAVAIGMAMCARSAAKLGLCRDDCPADIEKTLAGCGLPTSCPYGAERLAEACLKDKKRKGDSITLVVPEEIGRCVLRETPVSGLARFIGLGTVDG